MKANFKKWLKETKKEWKIASMYGDFPVHSAHYKEINQFAEDFAKQEKEPLIKMLHSLTNSMMAHPDCRLKGGEFDDFVSASIELLNKYKDES